MQLGARDPETTFPSTWGCPTSVPLQLRGLQGVHGGSGLGVLCACSPGAE